MLLALAAVVAVSSADYPQDALQREEEGVVTVAFNVDRGGFPELCHVIKSSGHPSLDRGACRLIINKAVFPPPAEAAVPYAVTKRIRWQIAREPERQEPDQVGVRNFVKVFGWGLLGIGGGSLIVRLARRRNRAIQNGETPAMEVAAVRGEVIPLILLLTSALATAVLLATG